MSGCAASPNQLVALACGQSDNISLLAPYDVPSGHCYTSSERPLNRAVSGR